MVNIWICVHEDWVNPRSLQYTYNTTDRDGTYIRITVLEWNCICVTQPRVRKRRMCHFCDGIPGTKGGLSANRGCDLYRTIARTFDGTVWIRTWMLFRIKQEVSRVFSIWKRSQNFFSMLFETGRKEVSTVWSELKSRGFLLLFYSLTSFRVILERNNFEFATNGNSQIESCEVICQNRKVLKREHFMTFLCNFFYETKEGRKEGKDERRAGGI